MNDKLYRERDPEALEPHYSKHMNAMTVEGLYSKSAIAEELAWRDAEIERLSQRAMPADADISEWMECERRRPYVVNSLKSRIRDLRDSERRCRIAFRKDFMGKPSQYLADALGDAASVLESRLSDIDARRPSKGKDK